MSSSDSGPPPDAARIAALAEAAIATIPAALRERITNIAVAVEDMPSDETLAELGIENAWDLTGLYQGTPLHRRGSGDPVGGPDLIELYRLPILLEWIETDADLSALVRNVLIHEVAHHFGFSDDDIEALERAGD